MIQKKDGESWSNAQESNLSHQFPLHHACRDGNSEMLKKLLTELQNNVSNSEVLIAEDPYYNWTAGHFAAYFGNLECLRLLMQASHVYNCSRASSGLPAMQCPLTVLSSRCRQSLLQVAAFANHPHCVQWLLNTPLNIDLQDVNGETALHKACRSGSHECANLLGACKADKSIRNDNGMTPAELATSCGHEKLGSSLVDVTNGVNGSTNGVHTNGTSHTNGFSTQSPSTPSPSVNHLVSSNGYYGYHQNYTQTSTTSTTASTFPSAAAASSSDMDMDEGVAVPSTSSNGFGAVNLLTDASVSQNLVPVAGKKRAREDDQQQQTKRGRFQDDSWSARSDRLFTAAHTTSTTSSYAAPRPALNNHSLFAGGHMTPTTSVLQQLGPRPDGGVTEGSARTQGLVTLNENCEMLASDLHFGDTTAPRPNEGALGPFLREAFGEMTGAASRQQQQHPLWSKVGGAASPAACIRNTRVDSGGSCSNDSQDSGITSMEDEVVQGAMDVTGSSSSSAGNTVGNSRCVSGTSGLSGCPIPAPVDLLAGRSSTTSRPHVFRPGHFF